LVFDADFLIQIKIHSKYPPMNLEHFATDTM